VTVPVEAFKPNSIKLFKLTFHPANKKEEN
jgi:hypothetical protein